MRRHVLLCCALLGSGCVTRTLNEDVIEQYMLKQQPQQALAELESRNIKERDRVLYFLDKAILLRMQGNFSASNAALEEAKSIADQTAAISLREQAGALSINDAQRSYALSDFEQALLYCIKSINYLELGQAQEARVEVLQLTEWLKQHEKFKLPFARYLSGLVFEFNNQADEALISYRQAYEEYRQVQQAVPLILQQDLLRLTDYLHISDEHQRYLSEFGKIDWLTQERFKQSTAVTVLVFNGLIPRKHSQEIAIQSPSDGQIHRISVPFYEKRFAPVTRFSVAYTKNTQTSELLAALNEHAAKALEEGMPAIVARTIARTGVKNKLMNEAADQNPMLGLALNVATFVTETADTRGWYTLPQQMLINRVLLDANNLTLTAQLSGSALPHAEKTWQIKQNSKPAMQLFSWHWTESQVL
ncbi:MAG TPA: hypothetical protein VFV48_06830 [Pseudomonadales bacterium]|nr:hypothetical protein [Pseudomonadales bacterium]